MTKRPEDLYNERDIDNYTAVKLLAVASVI
jgi:hypothetical protein